MGGNGGGGGKPGRSGGPGQVSTMESYADTATKERLLIIDESGKTIKDAGGSKGAVVWSGNDIPNNRGQYTFIHNHPGGESNLPSQSDLTLGARIGGKHIVTSPKTTISMNFGKSGSVKFSKRGEDPAANYQIGRAHV